LPVLNGLRRSIHRFLSLILPSTQSFAQHTQFN
jgi:hypothetical protein